MTTDTNILNESNYNELNELHFEYQQAMALSQTLPTKTVTFYGGANLDEKSDVYKEAVTLGEGFGKRKYGVITGGGPGVMKAGLEGVEKQKGTSIGFRLRLVGEEPELLGDIDKEFEHFPPRKFALRQANVYVYFPGSIGTLDELMENLDLMKTNKMPIKPIYLYHSKYWQGLIKWIESVIIDEWKLGSESIKKLYKIVDSPEELFQDLDSKK
jgi:uncharacterized protein (TIGR00730 family)